MNIGIYCTNPQKKGSYKGNSFQSLSLSLSLLSLNLSHSVFLSLSFSASLTESSLSLSLSLFFLYYSFYLSVGVPVSLSLFFSGFCLLPLSFCLSLFSLAVVFSFTFSLPLHVSVSHVLFSSFPIPPFSVFNTFYLSFFLPLSACLFPSYLISLTLFTLSCSILVSFSFSYCLRQSLKFCGLRNNKFSPQISSLRTVHTADKKWLFSHFRAFLVWNSFSCKNFRQKFKTKYRNTCSRLPLLYYQYHI